VNEGNLQVLEGMELKCISDFCDFFFWLGGELLMSIGKRAIWISNEK